MEIWGKIWNLKHWPKITLFLWLVLHSSILTWDNLLKRGFTGPSICTLCGKAEETMNHLLNTCHYTAQVWDQVAIIMRTSDRLRDSVIETLINWRDQPFSSPYLNRVWQLLPGFVLWQVWKERNNRIFRNKANQWSLCWDLCQRNLMETLRLKPWSEADLACSPAELPVLRHWTPPPPSQLSSPPDSTPPPPMSSPSLWSPPPKDFLKLNFDGASKGNPGDAGYGVIFRNHLGHIIAIGAGPLGHSTNNAAELWALINGLQMASQNNYTKLIVEGDSQVIIGLLRRILHGVNPDNISPSWRLTYGLQIIVGLLHSQQVIIPTHIRRKANQIADELANVGIEWRGPDLRCYSAQNPDHPILQQCIRKAGSVDVSPDGVLVESPWRWEGPDTVQGNTEPRDRPVQQDSVVPGD
jgi:ribonuclease HI